MNSNVSLVFISIGKFHSRVLSSVAGNSNEIQVALSRTIAGNVQLPKNSTIDVTKLEVALSLFEETFVNADGSFVTEVNFTGSTVITSLLELPDSSETNPRYAPYLRAVVLESDTSILIDTLSTAVALVWQGIGVNALVEQSSLFTTRSLLAELPEIQALGNLLEAKLATNPYILSSGSAINSEIESVAEEALIAAATAIQSKITNETSMNSSMHLLGKFGEDAEVTPSEADGISIFEQNNTGNITLKNDTQLYLSAKITADNGQVLLPHISGYAGMAGPQGYGLLFLATSTDYKHPNSQNCIVEVITPGIDLEYDPRTHTATYFHVWKWLYIRTVVERVLWPILSELLPFVSKDDFITILFNHAPNLVDIITTKLLQGKITESIKSLFTLLWQDFASIPPGPITKALVKKFSENIKNIAEQGFAKAAAKIAAKTKIILNLTSNYVNSLDAWNDILITDQVINFKVKFPLKIEEVIPSKVKPNGKNKNFSILGNGFGEIKRGIWPFDSTLKPKVIFTDTNGRTHTIEPTNISQNGTLMDVLVKGGWLDENTKGPLKVGVHHPKDVLGAIVEKSPAVEIVDKVEISSISPNFGGAGITVTVYGAGFSEILSDNDVMVDGVIGLVVGATETSLKIVIPAILSPGTHSVKARTRFDGEWSDWSNTVNFTVIEGNIKITVCDNGHRKDDAFALYVDGLYQGTIYASTGIYCKTFSVSMSPNTHHSATLLGIEAPDNIGTYGISFEGVTNLSGNPLQGEDLVPGVRKDYSFNIVGARTVQSLSLSKPKKGAKYIPRVPSIEETVKDINNPYHKLAR